MPLWYKRAGLRQIGAVEHSTALLWEVFVTFVHVGAVHVMFLQDVGQPLQLRELPAAGNISGLC